MLHFYSWFLNPRSLIAAILLTTSLVAGFALSGVLATHNDPAVVHLCVSPWTSQIRYVQDPTKCTNGSVIDVNQQGVPGPPGPEGPPGLPGVPGMDGQPGMSDFAIRVNTVSFPANFNVVFSVDCLPGEIATGGGFANPGIDIFASGPNLSPPPSTGDLPTSWTVAGYNGSGVPIDVSAYVICASV